MPTPVPHSPPGVAGKTGAHAQVQYKELDLPSKESSSPTDNAEGVNLIQDTVKVSTSDSSDKDEMAEGQSSSNASPLATHSTQPHSRLIKHIARTSSSIQGDPSSGFTFGKAQPVQADMMGKFKTTTPPGNPSDPTPPSAQPQPNSDSTRLEMTMPHVAQGKLNKSPMKIPFPEIGKQKTNIHAEASQPRSLVTSRGSSRRTQDPAAKPSEVHRNQRAKTDDPVASTGSANGVLGEVDPNAHKFPIEPQGIMRSGTMGQAIDVTSDDLKQRVSKKRRHRSGTLLVDNRTTHYDLQMQMQVFEAYNESQNRYCLLAQEYDKQCSLLDDMDIKMAVKDDEITQCDDALNTLTQMYEDKSKLLNEKEAVLSRFEQKKSQWAAKVKKLTNAVNGLCKDHNLLRDTGNRLLAQSNSTHADEESIREAFLAIKASSEADRAKSKDIASKYHEHVGYLERTILTLQSQRANSPQDAETEREKNARLEAELAKITNSYAKMRQEYAKSYSELNIKLEALLERPQATNTIVERTSADKSSPQLEECLSMLRVIIQQEHVKPSDVAKLEVSMVHHTQSVRDSIQEYAEKSEKANATAQSLARSVQIELQSLSGNAVKAEDLREQVAEHRETKASLGEQLHATKLRLVETQARLGSFEDKDRENRQRIQGYEADLRQAREKSSDPPAIMLRLHDLQCEKAKVDNEKAAMSHELQQLRQQLHLKGNDISELQQKADGLQSEVEQKTKAEENLRSSHVTLQNQMEQNFEAEKRKIIEDKDKEVENTLLDLRKEKQQILCGLEQSERLVNELREKPPAPSAEAIAKEQQQNEAISKLEREKQSEIATSRALRDKIKTLESKVKNGPSEARVRDLIKEVEKLRGQNEQLETTLDAAENGQQIDYLQQRVETLEKSLRQAPSTDLWNTLQDVVEELKIENRNLQGQMNRAQSESKSRKQEIKQLKASTKSATSQQVIPPAVDSHHGKEIQHRIIKDSQEKENDAGRDFQEILSSQVDEEEELDFTGICIPSPETAVSNQQQEHARISLPPKKAVRVQDSSGRLYNPSTPRLSSGGEDARQPPQTKGILRSHPLDSRSSAIQSKGSNKHELTGSQESTSSQGSSQRAEKPKVIAKDREPLPVDPRALRNLERMAQGSSNLKRDPADADLDAHVATGSKKSKIRVSSTLGPIVADSQSPNHLLKGRGRKVAAHSSRRQSYKESAMAARFKAERERTD